ncbi:MAG: hypothetical protein QOK43_3078, partial [Acidimicrobiaceae bacterium]|nr:hypothetical protein [Acidimicrobiaceae bacterium]
PRRAAGARFLAAGLAAAALIAVVLGVQVSRLDHRLDRVLTAMSERGVDQAALAAVTDPDARHVRLTSDDGARLADAVLLPNGQAYLVAQSLPALSDAETYQLWAVVDDEKISVGVLGAHPNVAAFHYDGQPTVLAITAERAGGVVASKKQAVVAGTVPPLST